MEILKMIAGPLIGGWIGSFIGGMMVWMFTYRPEVKDAFLFRDRSLAGFFMSFYFWSNTLACVAIIVGLFLKYL